MASFGGLKLCVCMQVSPVARQMCKWYQFYELGRDRALKISRKTPSDGERCALLAERNPLGK